MQNTSKIPNFQNALKYQFENTSKNFHFFPNSGLHSLGVKNEELKSTRNPVAVDWEDREVHTLGLEDFHFSGSILGVLEAILVRVSAC